MNRMTWRKYNWLKNIYCDIIWKYLLYSFQNWIYMALYYDRLNKIYSSNIQNYIILYNTVLLNISVQMSLESENKSVNKQICIIHLYTLSAKISNYYQHAYWEKVAKTILSNVNIPLYFLKLWLKEFSKQIWIGNSNIKFFCFCFNNQRKINLNIQFFSALLST